MRIDEKPAELWEEDDLRELCEEGRREGPHLEFKRELHLERDRDRSEVEHDVQGMANEGGGHLIYGIDEALLDDGSTAAAALAPLADGSLYERLNNVLDARGQPRVSFRLHAIDAREGGLFLVVEISGRRGPHQANDGRYYMRRNLLVRRMEEAEVAEAYRERFRRQRLTPKNDSEAVGRGVHDRVHRGLKPNELTLYLEETGDDSPPAWLSVVAYPEPLRRDLIDPVSHDGEDFRRLVPGKTWEQPFGIAYHWFSQSLDGFKSRLPPDDETYPSYLVYLWTDGVLEFGDLLIPALRQQDRRDNRVVPMRSVASYVHDWLSYFSLVYSHVGYTGPVAAEVRIDDLHGYRLGVERGRLFGSLELRDAVIDLPPWQGSPGELAGDAGMLAKALTDRLFVSAGAPNGNYLFDAHGGFVG